MSVTYGFALTGALIFALAVRTGTCFLSPRRSQRTHGRSRLMRLAEASLRTAADSRDAESRRLVVLVAALFLLVSLCFLLGRWRRVHAQAGRRESLDSRHAAAGCFLRLLREAWRTRCAEFFGSFPEVQQVVSQVAGPMTARIRRRSTTSSFKSISSRSRRGRRLAARTS